MRESKKVHICKECGKKCREGKDLFLECEKCGIVACLECTVVLDLMCTCS